MIATDDNGALAALPFGDSRDSLDKALEIAGDELTMPQMAEVFGKMIGCPVRFTRMPIEQVRSFDANLAKVGEWLTTRDSERISRCYEQSTPH